MPVRRNVPVVDLSTEPLSRLPGVGPRVAEKLAARGLVTMQDLWLHLPLRYEDRTKLTPILLLAATRIQASDADTDGTRAWTLIANPYKLVQWGSTRGLCKRMDDARYLHLLYRGCMG